MNDTCKPTSSVSAARRLLRSGTLFAAATVAAWTALFAPPACPPRYDAPRVDTASGAGDLALHASRSVRTRRVVCV